MITKYSRRDFLSTMGTAALISMFADHLVLAESTLFATSENAWTAGGSNFHAIYDDKIMREEFFLFLQNVYSIYPPEKFLGLILDISRLVRSDKEIYAMGQQRLPEIKPFAGDLLYGLPALFRQTHIIGAQIENLLKVRREINGYMEIGSKGGYIGYAKKSLKLRGDVILLHTEKPSYGVIDIFERRSLLKGGRFVNLNNYQPISPKDVKTASLDVVCNPIGFHHSPPELRDDFVRSIRRCLRVGGQLIVRDHDVSSSNMNHMVALAHDVFNMGLNKTWDYDQKEIRNFTSLAELKIYLERFGFRSSGIDLYQDGDPTKNALFNFIAE